MGLQVNGNQIDFVEGESIKRLLKRLKYVFPLVVVIHNEVTLPNEEWSTRILADGDVVDVVHLTSGG